MPTFTCAVCGKAHDVLPMDLAYKRPFDYFTIPEAERDNRIKISADLCSIDDHAFYIRGYLPVPIQDADQEFGWGVWVRVDEIAFYRYLELWDVDGTQEPLFQGRLSAELRGYPSTNLLEADVQLRRANDRPAIHLRPSDHPFVQEQMHGITMARVHEIVQTAMPWLFEA